MKLLIAIYYEHFDLWSAPSWLRERIHRDFPQLDVVQLPDYDRVAAEIADAEIYIGWYLRAEQFRCARRLRWIHSTAAGVHQLMSPELIASDVVVTNSRDVHGPVVAEHAIALVLALAKRLPAAFAAQQRREWAQQRMWNEQPRPREVAGATLGLVGFGAIGREIAARATALGMHVIAIREHPEKGSESSATNHVARTPSSASIAPGFGAMASSPATDDRRPTPPNVVGPAALDSILPRCDYVILCAPLTPATRGLFDARRLALLRPDSYLINLSRGPLIDEAALAAALANRTFAGAALDVFSREPLPADSPLWSLPNVFITPHTAAATEKLWERHYALVHENLRRYLNGEPLLYVVDKTKGY